MTTCNTPAPRVSPQQSAYYMDGLTRLGLVLQDEKLLARATLDIERVLADPNGFSNHPHGSNPPEGWPRNVCV